MPAAQLTPLSDQQLLKTIDRMVRAERTHLVDILHHLNEIDRRRLHLAMGFRSLFHYCVESLRYSESAAGRRIATARAMRRFPGIGPMLASGDVNLSTVSAVARLLTEDNHIEMIERIRRKSRREVERVIAEANPKPARPDRIRVICAEPTQAAEPAFDLTPAGGSESSKEGAHAGEGPARMCSDAGDEGAMADRREPGRAVGGRASTERSRPETTDSPGARGVVHEIRFVAGDAFMRKLERVRVLLSHRAPAASFEQVFEAAMEVYLDSRCPIRRDRRRRERRARQAETPSNPRAAHPGRVRAASSRHIPAAVRDAIFARDRGRCTFVGPDGRRCNSRYLLEVDHIMPFARGGAGVASNLRLLCHAHNHLSAERSFGLDVMNRYTCREPE